MTDEQPATPATPPPPMPDAPPAMAASMPAAPMPAAPVPPGYYPAYQPGPPGKVRGTGTCILLAIVTLGIYHYVYFYKVHDELKRHRGEGLGGGLALVITLFAGIAMPYITSSEVGNAYAARGQAKPVSGLTGLWSFPGALIIVGPIVWFVKTNGALNRYWQSVGAT